MKEHVVDKTGWEDGPWMSEPDKLQWRTESGLPGLIVRQKRQGALCGYAGVPREHPLYGASFHDVDFDVHGGLTYADRCMEDGPVCHVPEPGEPDDIWWFGFDCLHGFDFGPGMDARERSLEDEDPAFASLRKRLRDQTTYRDINYVRAEVESLARQLKEQSWTKS